MGDLVRKLDLSTNLLISVPNSASHCLRQVTSSSLLSFPPCRGEGYAAAGSTELHSCNPESITATWVTFFNFILFLEHWKCSCTDNAFTHMHTQTHRVILYLGNYLSISSYWRRQERTHIQHENSSVLNIFIWIRSRVSPFPGFSSPLFLSGAATLHPLLTGSHYRSFITIPVLSSSPGCPCTAVLSTHTWQVLHPFRLYLNAFWLVSKTNDMSSSFKHSPRMSLRKACAAKEVSQEETRVFLLAGVSVYWFL